MLITALNNSASPIVAGQIVRQTGFDSLQQKPTVALASAASSATASILGVAQTSISIGGTGLVVLAGNSSYSPINTTGFSVNATVYLSDTPGAISVVPGTISSVIGKVISVSVSGIILINKEAGECCNTGGSGVAGATGIQGLTGISGGGTGLFGATGIQGLTGISGGGTGIQGLTGISGSTGIISSDTIGLNLQGDLSLILVLPFVEVGLEVCGIATTYTIFRGRRQIPGTSGTTTIQLELNSVPVVGATLSWNSTDAAFTLKTTAISVAVTGGDYLSFRVTSIEGGNPQNIFTEVNS